MRVKTIADVKKQIRTMMVAAEKTRKETPDKLLKVYARGSYVAFKEVLSLIAQLPPEAQ